MGTGDVLSFPAHTCTPFLTAHWIWLYVEKIGGREEDDGGGGTAWKGQNQTLLDTFCW